jgi:hypothetical protein
MKAGRGLRESSIAAYIRCNRYIPPAKKAHKYELTPDRLQLPTFGITLGRETPSTVDVQHPGQKQTVPVIFVKVRYRLATLEGRDMIGGARPVPPLHMLPNL